MTRFAFVLGQDGSDALGRLRRLRFAASDARRLTERIKRKDLGFLVFPRGRGKSGQDLATQFDEIASGLIPSDEMLFYFSGYGVVQRDALFLMLNDTRDDQLDSTALPWNEVKNIINRSPALSKVAILDCCRVGETHVGDLDFADHYAAQRGSRASTLVAFGPNAAARESSTIGGGFLTALILQALGPKRRQAADGTGRVSMESLRDWMHDEIDHSESLAPIRPQKPLLSAFGGPSFYLDHQPIRPPADAARRPPFSDAASSLQSGVPIIRFLDALWPDPATVTTAKLAFQHSAPAVFVEWPRSTLDICSAFDRLTAALLSENDRPAELRARPVEHVAELHARFAVLRDRSRFIMEMVPRRLFMTWTNTHRNRHAIDETLRNFLALANLRVFYDLLINLSRHSPSFARAHIPRELTSWEAIGDSEDANLRASFGRLFGMAEPIYDAEVIEVDGISIESPFIALGPKQMLLEAAERSRGGKPIVNGWFFSYLVPQLELFLALNAVALRIPYSESAVLGTLHDGTGTIVRS